MQNLWSHDANSLDGGVRGVRGVLLLPHCLGVRTGGDFPAKPLSVAYAFPIQGKFHKMAVSIDATNKDHTYKSVSITVDSKRRATI